VRFCLICNYISKIDVSLQNEFICVRFNQLPKHNIYDFIRNIAEKEGIQISETAIDTIQTMYQSDIRSMINFLQLNQNYQMEDWNRNVMNSEILEQLHAMFVSGQSQTVTVQSIVRFIHHISTQYNVDKKQIIRNYLNHIIRNYPEETTPDFLHIAETIVHNTDTNIEDILRYFCLHNLKTGNVTDI